MSIKPDEGDDKKNRIIGWLRNITGWLVLLIAVVLALRPMTRPSPPGIDGAASPSEAAELLRPNPHIGPLDAPVTIVEFGDFACPACGVWNESGILQEVLAKYGDQVRFVWADYPSVTPDSPKAAEAARCAYDQGKFWEYHDYLYPHMEALAVNDLKLYASLMGLDRARFDQCLDSGARKAEISADFKDAVYRQVGVLPTFYIQTDESETRLVGPPSFELLVSVIDPLLARSAQP